MRVDSYRPHRPLYDPQSKQPLTGVETDSGGLHYDLFDVDGAVYVCRLVGEATFVAKVSAHGVSYFTGDNAAKLRLSLMDRFDAKPAAPAPPPAKSEPKRSAA